MCVATALQALAIYRTLNTEPPASSTDLEVEEPRDELDSGTDSTDDVVHSTEKVKAEETGEQTFAKPFDNI